MTQPPIDPFPERGPSRWARPRRHWAGLLAAGLGLAWGGLSLGSADPGPEPVTPPATAPSLPVPPAPPPHLPEGALPKPPTPPPNLTAPDVSVLRERLKLLDQFLNLPPEQLHRIRQTVESLEKMSSTEREALRKAIQEFFRLHPDEQQDLATRFIGQHSPEDRALLRRHWLRLSPTERAAERARLDALPSTERLQYETSLLERLRAEP